MESSDWYFLIALLLLVLLIGPGLWSHSMGWGLLDRLSRLFGRRKSGR
jgi:hypothetical protein